MKSEDGQGKVHFTNLLDLSHSSLGQHDHESQHDAPVDCSTKLIRPPSMQAEGSTTKYIILCKEFTLSTFKGSPIEATKMIHFSVVLSGGGHWTITLNQARYFEGKSPDIGTLTVTEANELYNASTNEVPLIKSADQTEGYGLAGLAWTYTGVTMPCSLVAIKSRHKKKATVGNGHKKKAAAKVASPAGRSILSASDGDGVPAMMASAAGDDVAAGFKTAIGGDVFNTGSFTMSRPDGYTTHRVCPLSTPPVSSINVVTLLAQSIFFWPSAARLSFHVNHTKTTCSPTEHTIQPAESPSPDLNTLKTNLLVASAVRI